MTFLDWLKAEIARYDRMVEQTEWQVDQIAYNEVAHALRRVRDRYQQACRSSVTSLCEETWCGIEGYDTD